MANADHLDYEVRSFLSLFLFILVFQPGLWPKKPNYMIPYKMVQKPKKQNSKTLPYASTSTTANRETLTGWDMELQVSKVSEISEVNHWTQTSGFVRLTKQSRDKQQTPKHEHPVHASISTNWKSRATTDRLNQPIFANPVDSRPLLTVGTVTIQYRSHQAKKPDGGTLNGDGIERVSRQETRCT